MVRVKRRFFGGNWISRHPPNAVLGISVGSRAFSKSLIEDYVRFCLDHYRKTLIVIVDAIKKYNFMALRGISECEAQRMALFEGNEMRTAVVKVLRKLKQQGAEVDRLTVMRWNEAVSLIPDYQKTVEMLSSSLEEDSDFRADAFSMVQAYLQSRVSGMLSEQHLRMAVQFLMQEIAFFLLIGTATEDGYCIDVYPGQFPVMEKIVMGKYKGVLKLLPKRICYGHVEIV